MRFRGIATGIVVLIAVSACTSGSDSDPSPPGKPKIVAPADALTMKEGREFDVVATLPKKIDGQLAYYEGVSPDGLVYGKTAEEDPKAEQPVGPGSTLITTRDDVFLLDPKAGRVTPISDGASRSRPVGVAGIDVDEAWVTWIEIEEGFGARWSLHSYDRSTGKEQRLGSHEDAMKGDTGVDFEGPKISGNQVVMSTFAFGDESATANQVLSAPLDGKEPMAELVGGATAVDVDADGISFIDAETEALTFRDAASGETKVLNDGKASECQRFHSRVLMTCEASGVDRNIRIKPNDGKPVSFGPFMEIGYPDLNAGWATIVIDADDKPTIYAIDTKRMNLYKVADTQGGWTLMGHNFALVQPFNGAKGDINLIKLH